ncbi:MAG: hypothetical protein IIX00_03895 [Tidjanibacter sp.]|nr:hypothetical protein [Tidjanibacter sp.]
MRKLLLTLLMIGGLATTTQAQTEGYNQAVKITFLSWATGSTKVSYEYALPNSQS